MTDRMTKYLDRLEKIGPLLDKGWTQEQIAKEIGLSVSSTGITIRKARLHGHLKGRVYTNVRAMGLRVGKLGPLIKNQSHDFQLWLAKEAKNDLTAADVAMSVLIDAYLDSTEEMEGVQ